MHSALQQRVKLRNSIASLGAIGMRRRLSQTKPAWPWVETLDSYRSRLKACAAYINNKYDVDGLCMALPRRLSLLEESWGDRISK